MNGITQSGRIAIAAYVAAILFAIHFITYFIPAIRDVTLSSSVIGAEALAIVAIAEHLVVFPVIEALPAPRWAKAIGYGWLVFDIATDVMQLYGTQKSTYLPLRYGANVAAAVWIASASWQATRAIRVIGIITAFTLALYSFIAFIPYTFLMLVPLLILFPLWFFLAGRRIARGNDLDPNRTKAPFGSTNPLEVKVE